MHVTVPSTPAGPSGTASSFITRRPSDRADVTRRHNIPLTKPDRTRRDLGWDKRTTRSDLERLFLRVCRKYEVPLPETNVKIGPHRIDALWRAERLIVEIDSYAYHADRPTFTADRARDRYLAERSYQVARISDDELANDPAAAARSLHSLLRMRRRAA